jgi:hypothetical protein
MNACRFRVLMTGLILSVFLGLSWSETPKNIIIPSEISAFYEDYNFISTYSTKAERERLIGCLGGEKIPEELNCQRLENVLKRMKKLRQVISAHDSEMVIWNGSTASFFGFHFRPVLFVVGEVQLVEEKALIEVRAYALEPDMVLRFIEGYENHLNDRDKNRTFEERIKAANMAAPSLEIHRWWCHNGKWMKSAADLFFLDEKY